MIDAALLPALLSLLAVARSGSVGAAARLQHRTSSAISQQIRKLERHLDVKLLERAGRGVRLTAAGEAALARHRCSPPVRAALLSAMARRRRVSQGQLAARTTRAMLAAAEIP